MQCKNHNNCSFIAFPIQSSERSSTHIIAKNEKKISFWNHTLHLIQWRGDVSLCRDVLQNHRQFAFILHHWVYIRLALIHNTKSLFTHQNHTVIPVSVLVLSSPWAAERTIPLDECQTPRSQRSPLSPPGSCCVRSDRDATRTPAASSSPAVSDWPRTTSTDGSLKINIPFADPSWYNEDRKLLPSGSHWTLGWWCCFWCWFSSCFDETCPARDTF